MADQTLPEGWIKSARPDGTVVYMCGDDQTKRFPKIPCELKLLPGWEHTLSKSTGERYYTCKAGNGGKGITQWMLPKEPCTAAAQAVKGKPKPLGSSSMDTASVASSGSGSPLGSPMPSANAISVVVTMPNGPKKFQVTPTKGGKYKKTRRNKAKSKSKSKSKKSRKNRNKK